MKQKGKKMTQEKAKHCNGCERHCEFDYFTRTRDKSIFPVIGKNIIQKYTDAHGTNIFISASEIHSAQSALKLAEKISLSCKHHFINQQRTK